MVDIAAGQYNPDSALGPAVPITTDYGGPAVGYPSFDSNGNPGYFLVNGLPPQPGAPYSDPCPPTFVDGNGTIRQTPHRSYEAAYIQFDMTINQYGWHDRQARIAVLNHDVFPKYRDELALLCRPGIALADMTSVWEEFLRRKQDHDLTGNGAGSGHSGI